MRRRRFIVLVAVLSVSGAGLIVWSSREKEPNIPIVVPPDEPPYEIDHLPGRPPSEDAVFDVGVELTYDGPKAILTFTVTEQHGWAAGTITIEYWYVEKDENGNLQQIGDVARFMCRTFLDYRATLIDSTTILGLEFPDLKDYGTSENWRAQVSRTGKVKAPVAE